MLLIAILITLPCSKVFVLKLAPDRWCKMITDIWSQNCPWSFIVVCSETKTLTPFLFLLFTRYGYTKIYFKEKNLDIRSCIFFRSERCDFLHLERQEVRDNVKTVHFSTILQDRVFCNLGHLIGKRLKVLVRFRVFAKNKNF